MRIAVALLLVAVSSLRAEDDRFAWAAEALAAPSPRQLALAVDATELPALGLLHARIVMRAEPGRLALRYPRWIPGTHAPSGPVQNLGGLVVRGAGVRLAWERDRFDPYLITVTVPPGTDRIAVDLTYIANQPNDNSQGVDVLSSAGHAFINLNCCLMIPTSADIGDWSCAVAARTPPGWQVASQLPDPVRAGDVLRHGAVSIEEAVDRPLLLGASLASFVLASGDDGWLRAEMHVAGEKPLRGLDERWLVALRRLPGEAEALFGGARTRSYRFLVALGEAGGLEHGACSYCGLPAEDLHDLAGSGTWARELLPHEFVHAWVGKHRRPAGMRHPDFQREQDCDGLWIYEGLTDYLGQVLAVRCGLVRPEEWRTNLVDTIAELAASPGRRWRSLRDTCRSSHLLRGWSAHHQDLRRGQDYYTEGGLFWLAADLIIRRDSAGERSLDDLCRSFFGPGSGPRDFSEDELIVALERLCPGDWRGRIGRWIDGVGDLDTAFLADTGWRRGPPAPVGEAGLALFRPRDARDLLGFTLRGGYLTEVLPGTPAARAGLAAGDYIHAINERELKQESLALARALAESMVTKAISLHVHRDGDWSTRTIAYEGGLVIPSFERVEAVPDRLSAILAPRTAAVAEPVAPIP